jgi:hypothetical protein
MDCPAVPRGVRLAAAIRKSGSDLNTIGVLLVEEDHGILTSIVRGVVQADPELELVGELTDIDDTSAAVERTGSEAIVWILGDARGTVAPAELLYRHPWLKVLAVERDGRQGFLWRMLPRRKAVGELSPSNLVAALRGGS